MYLQGADRPVDPWQWLNDYFINYDCVFLSSLHFVFEWTDCSLKTLPFPSHPTVHNHNIRQKQCHHRWDAILLFYYKAAECYLLTGCYFLTSCWTDALISQIANFCCENVGRRGRTVSHVHIHLKNEAMRTARVNQLNDETIKPRGDILYMVITKSDLSHCFHIFYYKMINYSHFRIHF